MRLTGCSDNCRRGITVERTLKSGKWVGKMLSQESANNIDDDLKNRLQILKPLFTPLKLGI